MPWQGHTVAKGRLPVKPKYKLHINIEDNFIDMEETVLHLSYKQARQTIKYAVYPKKTDCDMKYCLDFLHGISDSEAAYSFEFENRHYAISKDSWAHLLHGSKEDIYFLIEKVNLRHHTLGY